MRKKCSATSSAHMRLKQARNSAQHPIVRIRWRHAPLDRPGADRGRRQDSAGASPGAGARSRPGARARSLMNQSALRQIAASRRDLASRRTKRHAMRVHRRGTAPPAAAKRRENEGPSLQRAVPAELFPAAARSNDEYPTAVMTTDRRGNGQPGTQVSEKREHRLDGPHHICRNERSRD